MKGLWLGTVQLGLPYGIANRTGQPSSEEASSILMAAFQAGIEHLDTAQDYGTAETRIGIVQASLNNPFRITTKLSGSVRLDDAKAVLGAIRASGNRLQSHPETVLLHNPAVLMTWQTGYDRTLSEIVRGGHCRRFGVSVYSPEEFERALEIDSMEVIQAPANVFDRRLLNNGLYARAIASGRTVVIRSVFLQGLLLMQQPPAFAASAIKEWFAICREQGIAPALGALAYIREVMPDAALVLGCETAAQLRENVELFAEAGRALSGWRARIEKLAVPPSLIDPRTWAKIAS